MARTNPTRPSFPVHTVITLAVGSPNGANYARGEAGVKSGRSKGGSRFRREEKRREESEAKNDSGV